MIPDFFLFIVSSLLNAQFSTSFIASVSLLILFPTIARSSAYANAVNCSLFNYTIKSLNIIVNRVGDNTPP